MKPCRMRDMRLQSHMKTGLSKIDESVSEISAVKNDFLEWTRTTNNLLECLQNKTSKYLPHVGNISGYN
jgi:hypothetical protein